MHPDPQIIDDLVRRIVEVVHPRRIILFGSAARGDMGPDSDIDILVVVPDGTHRRAGAPETLLPVLTGRCLPLRERPAASCRHSMQNSTPKKFPPFRVGGGR